MVQKAKTWGGISSGDPGVTYGEEDGKDDLQDVGAG